MPRRGCRGATEEAETAYDDRILGDSQFVLNTLTDAEWSHREAARRATRRIGLEELGKRLATLAGVDVEELRSGSRRPAVVNARRALTEAAVGALGFSGSAVAGYLGVAASTVNRRAGAPQREDLARRLLEALGAGQKE